MKQMNFLLLLLVCFAGMPVWAGDDEKEETKSKPAYLELKPSIVANMAKGAKYVRFDVQLMLHKEEHVDLVKPHIPAVINEMLLLVSDQDGATLKTPDGKESFRKAAHKDVNTLLEKLTGKTPVKDLFFTTFYVR